MSEPPHGGSAQRDSARAQVIAQSVLEEAVARMVRDKQLALSVMRGEELVA